MPLHSYNVKTTLVSNTKVLRSRCTRALARQRRAAHRAGTCQVRSSRPSNFLPSACHSSSHGLRPTGRATQQQLQPQQRSKLAPCARDGYEPGEEGSGDGEPGPADRSQHGSSAAERARTLHREALLRQASLTQQQAAAVALQPPQGRLAAPAEPLPSRGVQHQQQQGEEEEELLPEQFSREPSLSWPQMAQESALSRIPSGIPAVTAVGGPIPWPDASAHIKLQGAGGSGTWLLRNGSKLPPAMVAAASASSDSEGEEMHPPPRLPRRVTLAAPGMPPALPEEGAPGGRSATLGGDSSSDDEFDLDDISVDSPGAPFYK